MDSPPSKKQRQPGSTILGIDIETGGSGNHPLVSVGTCLVQDGVTVEKRRFGIPFDRKAFCPVTKREFWDNENEIPGIRAALDKFEHEGKQAGDMHEAINQVATYIDKVRNDFPDVIVVSDNPEFDLGWLSRYFASVLGREGTNHSRNKDGKIEYRGVNWCLTTMRRMAGILQGRNVGAKGVITKPVLPRHVLHDHHPDNDAEYIAHCCHQLLVHFQQQSQE